jgi:glycosyltransferase involved in cell wall biosynthesis
MAKRQDRGDQLIASTFAYARDNSEQTMDCARISIIIPAYNVAPYVEEALDSVLNQTVAPFEVLVFDDGSTDGTGDVLEAYARHPLVQVFSHENKGQGPVRNHGAELARGDYVYFFDADDLLAASFIEQMQWLIARDRAPDLIMFSGRAFMQPGFSSAVSFDYQRKLELSGVDGEQALVDLYRARSLYAQVCLYIVRLDYWKRQSARFPPDYHQDEDVLFPLVAEASRVTVIRPIFFLRRVRPNSTMTMPKTARHRAARRRNIEYALRQLRSVQRRKRQLRKVARERCITMVRSYIEVANPDRRLRDTVLLARAYLLVRRTSLRRLIMTYLLHGQTEHRRPGSTPRWTP